MELPRRPPGNDDVAGRPRFRRRYLWWHAWPPQPTRQDLRDFYFTSLLAVAVTLVIGGLGLWAYTRDKWHVWPQVWERLDVFLIACAVAVPLYYGFAYFDWQRKRAV